MRGIFSFLLAVIFVCFNFATPALAFCGFYVAKADAKLYNQASQVAIARDGNRTILTMANDYQGQPQDFALVVPVPTLLKKEQVRIGDPKIMQRLDSFSAPRLVEYFDQNPCEPVMLYRMERNNLPAVTSADRAGKAEALGVKIEEQFSVGEYDILILSAKESNGLETWLSQNGYRLPQGAAELLQPYIRQELKFFVAKVNLKELAQSKIQKLRPLMIAYESARFMLPIRLGMTNSKGSQDLLVYLLSPKGQVELVNYRTAKIPTDQEIPVYVKDNFSEFYRAMFQNSHRKAGKNLAFLEYAWDMGNCDPCAAEPLSPTELRQAGVFWLDDLGESPTRRRGFLPTSNVFITRLHIRYDRATFPEDLQFKETANRQLFQGRYILRHPYRGKITCAADITYRRQVRDRQEREAENLAQLTGWNLQDIRRKSNITENKVNNQPFWRRFWR